MTGLEKLAKELGITTRAVHEADHRKRPDEKSVQQHLLGFHEAFEGEEILFGSATAQPHLLGHRKLRHPSCNLDYAVSKPGIRRLYERLGSEHEFHYDPRDFLHFEKDGLRIQVFYDNIFGWRGGPKFKEESLPVSIEGTELHVAAPEYTIMLKFRKAEERRIAQGIDAGEPTKEYIKQLSKVLIGKDRQDIFTLILASYFKPVDHINTRKIADLCYEHVSSNLHVMGNWLNVLYTEQSSLSDVEKKYFKDFASDKLVNAFHDRYLRGFLPTA